MWCYLRKKKVVSRDGDDVGSCLPRDCSLRFVGRVFPIVLIV